jgi:hypothetical protein
MGAAMGWTVHDIKRASVWEFFAAWQGYVDANTPKEAARLTESEAVELFEWIERDYDGPRTLTTQTYWLDGVTLVPAGEVTFTF